MTKMLHLRRAKPIDYNFYTTLKWNHQKTVKIMGISLKKILIRGDWKDLNLAAFHNETFVRKNRSEIHKSFNLTDSAEISSP